MYGLSEEISKTWLGATFAGYLIDFILIENFFVFLSNNGMGEFCKKRGVFFDYGIYEKFYLKKLQ